ncbi:MAG TPA: methyltransferase domain-containing protein [Saprospiraceae bacterium]|nr:methyltransferase domain-containing protein [Saprospiraceae bacterium]
MNYFKNIPEKLWLYWDGSPMSFLQFMTVRSFQYFHPAWTITLCMPKYRTLTKSWNTFEQKKEYTGKDYLPELLDSGIEILIIEMDSIGFADEASEIYKSDFIRYYLLGHHGGVWSDFDILYINSIYHLNAFSGFPVIGDEKEINTVIVPVMKGTNFHYYTIGFLMSAPNNPFFIDLAHACKDFADIMTYQSIGIKMIKKLFPTINDIKLKYSDLIHLLIPPHEVYLPFEFNELDLIFCSSPQEYIKNYTFGIHWFNGSDLAKEFQNAYEKVENPFKESTLMLHINYIKNKIELTGGIDKTGGLLDVFEKTYKYNLWKNQESLSGDGSTLDSTKDLRRDLATLIKKYEIHTIADMACGDFNWMKEMDFSRVQYYGIDIVPELIRKNNMKYAGNTVQFFCADLTKIHFMSMDLVILRDVLVHLPFEDSWKILRNIKASQSKYLLVTSFINDRINKDIDAGGYRWRTLSLHQAPFHFTHPMETIVENCNEGDGKFKDKSMILVDISNIKLPY